MAHSLTVLIAAHRRPDLLARTLDSLALCRKPEIYQGAVIVENGKSCGLEGVVRSRAAAVSAKYVYAADSNKSIALNVGLECIEDGLVFLTDDDVRFEPNVLEAYAVAAKGVDGGEFYGGPVAMDYETVPPEWLRPYLPLSAREWRLPANKKCRFRRPHLLGFNWCAFAKDLRAVGGFNPHFGPGSPGGLTGQETNAQRRLLAAGHRSWYVPEALVWHYTPQERCNPRWAMERMYRVGLETGISVTPPWRRASILPLAVGRLGLARLIAHAAFGLGLSQAKRYAARFYVVKWTAICRGLRSGQIEYSGSAAERELCEWEN